MREIEFTVKNVEDIVVDGKTGEMTIRFCGSGGSLIVKLPAEQIEVLSDGLYNVLCPQLEKRAAEQVDLLTDYCASWRFEIP